MSNTHRQKAKWMVSQMTLAEKASLCAGKNFWETRSLERLGVPSVMMTDGPHGLRKQKGTADHLGLNESIPATCFPAACASASSFDRDLLRQIGGAMAEECLEEGVSVLLGPGINIKRSPLCGRNFEYYSEDPFVAGTLGAALIEGVQERGVGTSLKHFAANNQEKKRMTSDSILDERTLRELYLAGFETAVKQAKPWTVMCSYNRVDGVLASQNRRLLTDILRDEWGYGGLTVTDWGACDDRVEGLRAGMDLEMPGPSDANTADIVRAVEAGALTVEELDRAVVRNVELALRGGDAKKPGFTYSRAAHHGLARSAVARSAVLLENRQGALPLDKGATVAVLGTFAKTPRYQGAGSSKINPHEVDSPLKCIRALGVDAAYGDGYDGDSDAIREDLLEEARALAAQRDCAVVFAGLPDRYESEGFDRPHMNMPENHNRLIEEVAKVNPNTVVVLMCGAPVLMPWADKVRGILLCYLGGEAVGGGCADLLFGDANPSGRLAETFPLAQEDCPCAAFYPGTGKTAEYREAIYVGYRYYDKVGREVAYPFGYGLSYTTFAYSGLALDKKAYGGAGTLQATLTVTNTGGRAGAEVVQLYVAKEQEHIFRAPKELKGFEKIYLEPGESKAVTFTLDRRAFAYYSVAAKDWAIEGGEYQIQIAASSRDIRLIGKVLVQGDGAELAAAKEMAALPAYFNPSRPFAVEDSQFAALYGKPLPPAERQPGEPFDQNSTVGEIAETRAGRQFLEAVRERLGATVEGDGNFDKMLDAMFLDLPLRGFTLFAPGILDRAQLDNLLTALNAEAGTR